MATFVLVHGAGTGGWLWDDVADLLRAAGHQVAAPSLLGVGDQPADDDSLTAHINQVVQLVQNDHADPVVLVGFSYGGFVEARREAPVREEVEEAESYTYSSDRGAEPEGEGDKKRKRRPRRRRAKPEAIAARLKTGGDDGGGTEEATEPEQEG